ncbi:MAG: helix-turn-helix domain-containing protein [Nitrospinota bacterium]
MNLLGDHIRERRLDLGPLQREMAQLQGGNATTVQFWETGRNAPSLPFLAKIAAFLGYTPWHGPPRNLGEKIGRARKRLGMSQEASARELNIDVSTLARWEKGKGCPAKGIPGIIEAMFKNMRLPLHSERETHPIKNEAKPANGGWAGKLASCDLRRSRRQEWGSPCSLAARFYPTDGSTRHRCLRLQGQAPGDTSPAPGSIEPVSAKEPTLGLKECTPIGRGPPQAAFHVRLGCCTGPPIAKAPMSQLPPVLRVKSEVLPGSPDEEFAITG